MSKARPFITGQCGYSGLHDRCRITVAGLTCACPCHLPKPEEPAVTVRHDLPEHEYHALPSLSHSGAVTLATRTPAHFAHQREHGRPDTAAFDLGHAVHRLVLGKGADLHIVPAADWRTKAAKDEAATARRFGMTPLLEHEYDQARTMAERVLTHEVAGPIFATGQPEVSYFWTDPATGVECRARADWVRTGGARTILVDLKTTVNADPDDFASSAAKFGYHQQDAWYTDGWQAATGEDAALVFVCVEKAPPHLVTVAQLDPLDVDLGRALNRRALDLFAHCTAVGDWPGYEPAIHTLTLPGWYRRKHEGLIA